MKITARQVGMVRKEMKWDIEYLRPMLSLCFEDGSLDNQFPDEIPIFMFGEAIRRIHWALFKKPVPDWHYNLGMMSSILLMAEFICQRKRKLNRKDVFGDYDGTADAVELAAKYGTHIGHKRIAHLFEDQRDKKFGHAVIKLKGGVFMSVTRNGLAFKGEILK